MSSTANNAARSISPSSVFCTRSLPRVRLARPAGAVGGRQARDPIRVVAHRHGASVENGGLAAPGQGQRHTRSGDANPDERSHIATVPVAVKSSRYQLSAVLPDVP